MTMQNESFDFEQDEQLTALEDELRSLRYARHSLTHSEPDDASSRAYVRWKDRQDFLTGQIEDAEQELAALRAGED